MRKVDDGFPGIEICSLKKQTRGFEFLVENLSDRRDKVRDFFGKLTGRKSSKKGLRTGITLIGPAKVIKSIKKNPNSFSVLAEA